jgi:hypothetical protein
MAKTFTSPFAQTINNGTAVTTLAVALAAAGSMATDTVTPANVSLLLTAGAEGSLVTSISMMPRMTITACNMLLFTSLDGTSFRLIDSVLLPASTLSATAALNKIPFPYTEDQPLRLKANERLYVGCTVAFASGIVSMARALDY